MVVLATPVTSSMASLSAPRRVITVKTTRRLSDLALRRSAEVESGQQLGVIAERRPEERPERSLVPSHDRERVAERLVGLGVDPFHGPILGVSTPRACLAIAGSKR